MAFNRRFGLSRASRLGFGPPGARSTAPAIVDVSRPGRARFEPLAGLLAADRIFVDANSNLSLQGERLYTGDFANTLRHALPSAVRAPEGQRMHIKGLEDLKRDT